jgi:hypothetical protein
MGAQNDCFRLFPADARIRDGNKWVEAFFSGFTVNEGLSARFHIAFQHHSADSCIGYDVDAIGMADALNQDVIEDLALPAVIRTGIFMGAVHNDGLQQGGMPGQHVTCLADTDRVVVGSFATP